MPDQTVAHLSQPVRTAAYLDFLQMLTGIGLILFMWSHMVLVASINLGASVMNAIARFLEDTYLAQRGRSAHFDLRIQLPGLGDPTGRKGLRLVQDYLHAGPGGYPH